MESEITASRGICNMDLTENRLLYYVAICSCGGHTNLSGISFTNGLMCFEETKTDILLKTQLKIDSSNVQCCPRGVIEE